MDDYWIVVANRAAARFFSQREGETIREQETLFCPEARQPERDVLAGAPGRTHDRMGAARHAMEPRTHAEDQLLRDFAARIADHLETGRTAHSYRHLVLVAGPELLGELRSALNSHCRDLVVAECAKNIVHEDIPEIIGVLPYELQQKLRIR